MLCGDEIAAHPGAAMGAAGPVTVVSGSQPGSKVVPRGRGARF